MFMINTPSNMGALQGALKTIASFEIIPGEFFEENFYNMTDEDKGEPDFYFEQAGYDSHIFMLTMGLPFYSFVISLAVFLLSFPAKCICRCEKVANKIRGLQEGMMWNFFVRFFLEMTLELSICILLNFKDGGMGGTVESMGFILAIVFCTMYAFFFVFVVWLLFCGSDYTVMMRLI